MTLKLKNISKRFGDKWILRDFSLEIAANEVFGLLGSNGSGKTTILRIIEGAEKPNSGAIEFQDQEITNVSAAARGFSFPHNESKASWRNLFKSAEIAAASEQEKLKFTDALANTRKVLLLDNNFSCFDQNFREEALRNLRRAAKQKDLAIVFVTNDHEEAFAVCDRVGVLHKGELAQTGTPRELYENPNSTAVARALGRINLIEARRVTFNNQPIPEFQTLVGNHRLQTGKSDKNSHGAITNSVTLAIRPEHISLSFGASFPEDNLLKAKITEVQYRGATTRVFLDANDLILEALVLRLVGLNVGDECMVGMPPDRMMVLKQ